MKKILFPVIVLIIIIIAGIAIYASTKGEEKSDNNSLDIATETNNTSEQSSDDFKPGDSISVDNPVAILFYGNGCPHCEDVDKWITENNVTEKVKFDRLEVWYNKDNSKILSEKADSCELAENSVGVPFLYDIENNKCMSGTDKVIDFFKSKI